MIPKKIHYVWVGGKELPVLEKKCLKSWNKYLPDYDLCLRDESNFDMTCNQFVKQAYEAKKYAFVSDYIRIWALYNFGGVYLDTDVEVIKNLDSFLNCKGFGGFEGKDLITTGVIASEKNNPFMNEILNRYDCHQFDPNNLVPNPIIITGIAKEKYHFKGGCDELVKLKDDVFRIYPKNYFCPISSRDPVPNYQKCIKDNSCYTIHWFVGSWLGKSKFRRFVDKIEGQVLNKVIHLLKKIHLYEVLKEFYHKIFK